MKYLKMKGLKVGVAALVTLVLVGVMLPWGFADPVIGIVSSEQLPTASPATYTLTVGDRVTIPIPASMFDSGTVNAPTPAEIKSITDKLSVAFPSGTPDPDNYFTYYFVPSSDNTNPIDLVFVTDTYSSQVDETVKFELGLNYTDGGITSSSVINTNAFTATFKATDVESVINGFSSSSYAPTGSATVSIAKGGYFDIPLTDGYFSYTPGTNRNPLNEATLRANVSLTSPDSGFKTEFSGTSIRVTADSANAGTYNNFYVTAQYTGSATGGSTGTALFGPYSVTVTDSGTDPTDPADVGKKITGVVSGKQLGYDGNILLNGSNSLSSLTDLEVKPGDTLSLVFYSDFFQWDGATPAQRGITSNEINAGNVKVTSSGISTGSGTSAVVRSITTGSTTGTVNGSSATLSYVQILFNDNYSFGSSSNTATNGKSFSFTVNLTAGASGSTSSGQAVTVSGTLKPDIIEITGSGESVDISGGEYAGAVDASYSNVEFHLGEGVYAVGTATRNRLYYGTATTEPTNADTTLLDRYSQLVDVFNLSGNLSGMRIGFDDDYYDGYYGTSGSSTYLYGYSNGTFTELGTMNSSNRNRTYAYYSKYFISDGRLPDSATTSSSSSSSGGGADDGTTGTGTGTGTGTVGGGSTGAVVDDGSTTLGSTPGSVANTANDNQNPGSGGLSLTE